jgi:hypothetical protein
LAKPQTTLKKEKKHLALYTQIDWKELKKRLANYLFEMNSTIEKKSPTFTVEEQDYLKAYQEFLLL